MRNLGQSQVLAWLFFKLMTKLNIIKFDTIINWHVTQIKFEDKKKNENFQIMSYVFCHLSKYGKKLDHIVIGPKFK